MSRVDTEVVSGVDRTRRMAVVLAAALLVSYASTWFGATTWGVGGIAAIAVGVWIAPRCGVWLAGMAGLCLALLVVLDVLVVSPYLGFIPFNHAVNAMLALLGAAAVAGLIRSPARSRPRPQRLWPTAAAFAGTASWVGVAAYGLLTRFELIDWWVVHGDGRYNYPFALALIERNGIGVAPGEYAVPLPTAIIGLEIAARRPSAGGDWTAQLDRAAFLQAWALTVPLSSVLAGLGAMVLIPATRRWLRAAFGAVGSLVPVSPLVFGVAYNYGFFNVGIVVALLMVAWVVYARRSASPPVALAILVADAALMLEAWSPLVLVPTSFGAALVWCERGRLRAWTRRGWTIVALAAAQFLVFGFVLILPAMTLNGAALRNDGGMAEVRPLAAVLLAVVAVVLVLLHPDRGLRVGIAAVVAALVLGAAVLLWVNRDLPDPWIYYPQKYAWFGAVLLIVISIALFGAFWARASLARRAQRSSTAS